MAETKPVRFRTQYDTDYRSEAFDTAVGIDEGLVQQSFKDECDINQIMKKYEATGDLTHVMQSAAQFGDYSDVMVFQDAQNFILDSQALFMEIPASIRDRFNNDPAKFIAYATDEKNLDSLREMGLAPPAPVQSERSNSETKQVPPAKPETPPKADPA